jgi:hypothetical protein
MSQTKNNMPEDESIDELSSKPEAEMPSDRWFICKQSAGTCHISNQPSDREDTLETWGPFASQGEAIAKRIGLIRAGKCQPL